MKDTLDVDIVHVYLGLSLAVDSAGAGPDWAGHTAAPASALHSPTSTRSTEPRGSGPPEYNAHVE